MLINLNPSYLLSSRYSFPCLEYSAGITGDITEFRVKKCAAFFLLCQNSRYMACADLKSSCSSWISGGKEKR